MRLKLALASALFAFSPAMALELGCEDTPFTAEAADPTIARRTCEAASEARQVLKSCGVEISRPIRISVVEAIKTASGPCLGLFHCGEDRIEIVSPVALPAQRKTDGAFAEVSDDALWRSVLVHELTHAAYDEVPCPFTACVATDEYAAFVMQIRSLPPEERENFGTLIELKGKANRDAISAVMLQFSPDRFAKYAWLHFRARPDPCAFMQKIMGGEVVFDRERFYGE